MANRWKGRQPSVCCEEAGVPYGLIYVSVSSQLVVAQFALGLLSQPLMYEVRYEKEKIDQNKTYSLEVMVRRIMVG